MQPKLIITTAYFQLFFLIIYPKKYANVPDCFVPFAQPLSLYNVYIKRRKTYVYDLHAYKHIRVTGFVLLLICCPLCAVRHMIHHHV